MVSKCDDAISYCIFFFGLLLLIGFILYFSFVVGAIIVSLSLGFSGVELYNWIFWMLFPIGTAVISLSLGVTRTFHSKYDRQNWQSKSFELGCLFFSFIQLAFWSVFSLYFSSVFNPAGVLFIQLPLTILFAIIIAILNHRGEEIWNYSRRKIQNFKLSRTNSKQITKSEELPRPPRPRIPLDELPETAHYLLGETKPKLSKRHQDSTPTHETPEKSQEGVMKTECDNCGIISICSPRMVTIMGRRYLGYYCPKCQIKMATSKSSGQKSG